MIRFHNIVQMEAQTFSSVEPPTRFCHCGEATGLVVLQKFAGVGDACNCPSFSNHKVFGLKLKMITQ